jgi:hypothetical protein
MRWITRIAQWCGPQACDPQMTRELLIGVADIGIMHTVPGEFDLDGRFRMVRDAGVFDYIDKTPAPDEIAACRDTMQRYAIPLTASSHYYLLGRDEALLQDHLRQAGELGTRVHNVQLLARDGGGNPVTDEQVARLYLEAVEWGDKAGVIPCFEVHVGMWSEQFTRIDRVADLVAQHGCGFAITLDHSHVVFAIDNPEAQDAMGIRADVEAGAITLDPDLPGNICDHWIACGLVRHAHARAAAPNGPRNLWMTGLDGQPGLAIQYPFLRPVPGQWHSPWHEDALAPWKTAVRRLLRHFSTGAHPGPAMITAEFIPFADYGGGAKYSQFENNIACAVWLRAEWEAIVGDGAPGTTADGTG